MTAGAGTSEREEGPCDSHGRQQQQFAQLGCNVLIDLNDGDRLSFARLHPSATIKIGTSTCSLSPLVNSPFGSIFELQRGPKGPCLVRVPPSSAPPQPHHVLSSTTAAANPDPDSNPAADRDNRSLIDDNTAQSLSADDIASMRRQCASGKDIVDALVANSKTFQSKTAYSQEKYRRKKQKKYAPCFVLRRPTARRVCEAYFKKSPQKIGFLRVDMLGLMLSFANVGAHAEVLVMDAVGGLLTAAVAERTGGFGSVCSVYCSDKPPPMDIVGLLNLSNDSASRVFRASISQLSEAFGYDAPNVVDSATKHDDGPEALPDAPLNADSKDSSLTACDDIHEDITVSTPKVNEVDSVPEVAQTIEAGSAQGENTACGDIDMLSVNEDETKPTAQNGSTIVRPGRYATSSDLSVWAKHGFTSLLIGAPEIQPWNLAQKLVPFLCSSAPFAIYHPYLQPLAECMHQLKVEKMAVALEIVEPWLREYQVLPSRTHPKMQMSATGGYLLTGIKVVNS